MASQQWVKLGDVIPSLLRVLKGQIESPIHKVVELWESAVGAEVAAHAKPLRLTNGLLVVSVDSSVWAAELARFRSEEIIRRVNHAVGSPQVRQLRFLSRASTRRVRSGGKEYGEGTGTI